jgi:uncharacterized protein
MVVVSDTSPVTSLIQIGRIDLLQRCFEKILIPRAVENELLAYHSKLPEFLRVAAVTTPPSAELLQEIDAGEAEVILLAEEIRPDFVLIDDAAARTVAVQRGLPVIGVLGLLLKAKQLRYIDSVQPLIADLEKRSGFFVAPELKHRLLSLAGEV